MFAHSAFEGKSSKAERNNALLAIEHELLAEVLPHLDADPPVSDLRARLITRVCFSNAERWRRVWARWDWVPVA